MFDFPASATGSYNPTICQVMTWGLVEPCLEGNPGKADIEVEDGEIQVLSRCPETETNLQRKKIMSRFQIYRDLSQGLVNVLFLGFVSPKQISVGD